MSPSSGYEMSGSQPLTSPRCYGCDQAEVMYEAHLDHDATPVVLLCDACAIWEREAGSVVWIRTYQTRG